MTSDHPKLEIINGRRREKISPEDFLELDHQGNLFASPRRGLLIIVSFPDVSDQEFRDTLANARPSKVLELRAAPRFDFGNLNRSLAFQLFSESKSTYIDLSASGEKSGPLLSFLDLFLRSTSLSPDRPIMILLNKCDSGTEAVDSIRRLISSAIPEFTDLYEVPHFSQIQKPKSNATTA